MRSAGVLVGFAATLTLWSATPAVGQEVAPSCTEVFAGAQGPVRKEAQPPRYTPDGVPKDNGDGTFTLSYGIVLSRYLGPEYLADVYDCAFVDANASSLHDEGEVVAAVSHLGARFRQVTSSSVLYVLTVTIAAEPGDQVCDRAQVTSSYDGSFVDTSQYFCERLPVGGDELPAGPLGALGGGIILGGGLILSQHLARRRCSTRHRVTAAG